MKIVVVVLLSHVLNALAYSIDHSKSREDPHEVWHILKLLSCLLPYTVLLLLSGVHYGWWAFIVVMLWIAWEFFHKLGRYLELYRLDDRWRIWWLNKIFSIKF